MVAAKLDQGVEIRRRRIDKAQQVRIAEQLARRHPGLARDLPPDFLQSPQLLILFDIARLFARLQGKTGLRFQAGFGLPVQFGLAERRAPKNRALRPFGDAGARQIDQAAQTRESFAAIVASAAGRAGLAERGEQGLFAAAGGAKIARQQRFFRIH